MPPRLAKAVQSRPESEIDIHRAVIGESLARDRDIVLRRLRRLGVMTLDASPAEVGTAMINRYLDVKRRERV